MRYLVRINPHAINPITKKIVFARIWEVEQVAFGASGAYSEAVKWHCSNVKVDGVPILKIFKLPKKGEKPTEMEFFGICTRDGYEDAILINTKGCHEVN
jgi:hypothetical protein